MKAIALGNRLARDISGESVVDMGAGTRLEILDAINGGLQTMHAHAPAVSKITSGSIYLEAPITVELGLTRGSVDVSGYPFTQDQFYRTIRIAGDDIDNQIASTLSLLHPYTGESGTVAATIYSDGVAISEPYEELIGDPRILETGRYLHQHEIPLGIWHRKQAAEPRYYWLEANASNRNSPAPAVLRLDCLPDRAYRMQAKFSLAPARVNFSDLLAPGAEIPLRAEFVEVYLLPIARGILTSCELWRDPATKSQARADAEAAEAKYKEFAPTTLATPSNHVGTPDGF